MGGRSYANTGLHEPLVLQALEDPDGNVRAYAMNYLDEAKLTDEVRAALGRVSNDEVAWRCSYCGTENPAIESARCIECTRGGPDLTNTSRKLLRALDEEPRSADAPRGSSS